MSARMPGGIWANVQAERDRQDRKWGEQNHHPYKWLSILMEEVGEASKAVLESELVDYHKELTHVAAVAIAAAESLERNLERDNAVLSGPQSKECKP